MRLIKGHYYKTKLGIMEYHAPGLGCCYWGIMKTGARAGSYIWFDIDEIEYEVKELP